MENMELALSSSAEPAENAPILAPSSSPSETVVAIPDDHSIPRKFDVFLNSGGLLQQASSDKASENSPLLASSSSPPDAVVAIHDDRSITAKFDVFLNFRGEDTRTNVVSHLRKALSEKQIKTFVDDKMERGQNISPQLLQAIEVSRCALVIFSQDYASSSWCLDELVKILDCKQTRGQVVIPVFFRVEPSHVRKQKGSFGDAFEKHENDFSKDRMEGWRNALKEVASLSGLDFKNFRDEADFIKDIVSVVSGKLGSMDSSNLNALASCAKTALGLISFALFFFLVVTPLMGLLFFKVLVPIMEPVMGFPGD